MLNRLSDADDIEAPEPIGGPDHPMRIVTRQVAFEDGWSPGRAAKVAALFDSMAAEWSESHVNPTKAAPIRDALRRGGVEPRGRWLELGSGTGAGTRVLDEHGVVPVALDLSAQMLVNAPDLAPRVRGDSSSLPFPDNSFETVLLVNMLLFPTEVTRVLVPDGALIWVNTLGDRTPIHLSADDVVEALPGSWGGSTANAGMGLWAVLRRI